MAVAALDTLSLTKRLRAAGFTEDQAEAVTDVVRQASQADTSALATKAELAVIKANRRAEVWKSMIGGLIGLQALLIISTSLLWG